MTSVRPFAGTVESITGLTIEARDLALPVGSLCRITSLSRQSSQAEVIGFQSQRTLLDRAIANRVAHSADAQLLLTLPGAGGFMALGLAAHVGDIRRFPRPRSLANYWGLTPSCRNTGEKTQRLGSISKEGSTLARFLLGQLVMHVLKRDGRLRSP